jgi:hypothetical protein
MFISQAFSRRILTLLQENLVKLQVNYKKEVSNYPQELGD